MNLDITKHEHFKLYILVEDKFTFESELLKNKIAFYSNSDEQVGVCHSVRYYLKEDDRIAIDRIIRENQINSGTESTGVGRFEFNRKPLKKLMIFAFILIVVFLIINYLF